jgi:hypothetical protein
MQKMKKDSFGRKNSMQYRELAPAWHELVSVRNFPREKNGPRKMMSSSDKIKISINSNYVPTLQGTGATETIRKDSDNETCFKRILQKTNVGLSQQVLRKTRGRCYRCSRVTMPEGHS